MLFLQFRCRASSYSERCRQTSRRKAGLGTYRGTCQRRNTIQRGQHASVRVHFGVPERHVSHYLGLARRRRRWA